MVRWKLTGLRILLDALAFFILYKAYFWGIEIGIELFGFDWWFVKILYGATIAAVIYYLFGYVKNSLFFMFKSATIWALCNHGEETSIFAVLGRVTVGWKETFSIPLINEAVRGLFKNINEKITDEGETPEILKSLESSSGFKGLRGLAIKTFDYADECVLAWCYSHEDCLLQECVTGVAVFIQNSVKLMAYLTPVILLQSIVRVVACVITIRVYLGVVGLSLTTIVPCYVVCLGVDFLLKDAILEPFLMDGVVRKYLECKNTEGIENVVESLRGVLDFSKLDALLRRFKNDGDETGTDDGNEQNVDTNGVE